MYCTKLRHVCIVCLPTIITIFVTAVDNVILDPALFLGPSPPMLPTSHTDSPLKRWFSVANSGYQPKQLHERRATSHNAEELMENAETFWPSLRTAYGVRVVSLSFSASGTYGKHRDNAPGVVASSYISATPINIGVATKCKNSGLAGSSYGNYGIDPSIRVFSGGVKTGWSGWGNGKWGHYGKG